MRPGERGEEQARRLADQAVAGGGVQREPAADEGAVLVDRSQPALLELFSLLEDLRTEKLVHRRPVGEPDRDFQRARPVRPVAVRAGDEPALQVLLDHVEVGALAAQRVRLGEHDEVAVAVRLPQVLDVADQVGVAGVEQLAEHRRRLDAALRVAVPARRRADVHAAQRVDIEPALGDAVGRGDARRLVHLRIAMQRGIPGEREVGRRHLGAGARALEARLQQAQHAPCRLGGRHAAHPLERLGEARAKRPLQPRRKVRCQISRFRSVQRAVSWLRRPAR